MSAATQRPSRPSVPVGTVKRTESRKGNIITVKTKVFLQCGAIKRTECSYKTEA